MATALKELTQDSTSHGLGISSVVDFIKNATVDEPVLRRAIPMILDTFAVMIAGGAEPGVRKLASGLEPATPATGVSSFWSKQRYRDDDAALLFGMASHVLDYDDVCMLAICHPSAPILTALLAGANWKTTSGRDFLEAFLVGTEILVRIGQVMGFRHYQLGFHATATLGTIGATAALARLRKLDESRTRHALSIAASSSGGLRVNFGSLMKSVHVGIAASNAVRAVKLAAAGIEGAVAPFDGNAGFLHAFSGGTVSIWDEGIRLGQPFALENPGFEQKRYPCCYMLHKMIEGALALRREMKLDFSSVASVRVDVAQGGSSALIHPFPKSGLNALFSAPYAILACLADGKINLSSFTDEAVMRPQIQSRLHDVLVVEDKTPSRLGSDVGAAPVTVTFKTSDGKSISQIVTSSPGSAEDPITPDQLRAKWMDCLRRASPGISKATSDELFDLGFAVLDEPEMNKWLQSTATVVTGQ
jgi:2-methylcitrate dehydratase PrpD